MLSHTTRHAGDSRYARDRVSRRARSPYSTARSAMYAHRTPPANTAYDASIQKHTHGHALVSSTAVEHTRRSTIARVGHLGYRRAPSVCFVACQRGRGRFVSHSRARRSTHSCDDDDDDVAGFARDAWVIFFEVRRAAMCGGGDARAGGRARVHRWSRVDAFAVAGHSRDAARECHSK